MRKAEIVKQLAARIYGNTGESEREACTQFCDTLAMIFTDALLSGEKVVWDGVLTMEVKECGECQRRNPQTNEIETFPPSKRVKIKASNNIKNLVKES